MKNDYMSLYIKHQIIEGVFDNDNLFHIPSVVSQKWKTKVFLCFMYVH